MRVEEVAEVLKVAIRMLDPRYLHTVCQMLWVQRMNAVRETATEIVNNDLIYV